jgi:transposase-like protein
MKPHVKPGRDPLTLTALQARFCDEDKCLAFLERARWPSGPECPHCGVVNRASRVARRPGQLVCRGCGKSFSVTSGTPMHKTHLSVCIWITATYLIATSSNGISSLKLASLLGLQYRTTWHLAHRIRAMMDSNPGLLTGIVELDETYMGGKPRAKKKPQPEAPAPLFEEPEPEKPAKVDGRKKNRGRGTDKPMAFTAVARGGEVRLTPILSHGTVNLIAPVRRWVDPSAIFATDELPAYLAIGRQHGGHIRVNHSAGEFVRKDVRTGLLAHCNTAESVHALFKRAIIGVFHSISDKHMGRYLREVEFHWNNRGSFKGRLTTLFATKSWPLPLKALFA